MRRVPATPRNALAARTLIVHAERDTVVIARVEIRDIMMQVLLWAVLTDALHAALEHAVEAFDRAGVVGPRPYSPCP